MSNWTLHPIDRFVPFFPEPLGVKGYFPLTTHPIDILHDFGIEMQIWLVIIIYDKIEPLCPLSIG